MEGPCSLGGDMCKYVNSCSFYQEFARRKSLIWKAMVKSYCDEGSDCVRYRKYETEEKTDLSKTLLPSGSQASKAFLALP
jgi:hypothetical protein